MSFVRVVAVLLLMLPGLCAFAQTSDPATHVWMGKANAATIEKRINDLLSAADSAVAQVLAVKGPRTVENTLQPLDEAFRLLNAASAQSAIMQQVHPESAVRDKAQALAEKASVASTELALNRKVYDALTALDLSKADATTKYYVSRLILQARLSGVDRDEAERTKIKALNDEITKLSLEFQRNTQEDVRKVELKSAAELDGLPQDYIDRHKPAADGTISLTSEPPDVVPVMKFAKSAELRRRVYLAYNNRAYPKNEKVLADLLAKRQELATMLGYPRWAELNAADKMVMNAKTVSDFMSRMDEGSKQAAEREFQMLMAAARKQEPSLKTLSFSDNGYYSEQLRRSDFNFDSQSARPYFPYDRVQQGILDVASKLFHVSFRPVNDAEVWDKSVSVFDVYEGTEKLGRIYLDMHPRAGKDKWFSSNEMLSGKKGKQLPEALLICNFSGGKPGDPGLMEYGDVTTFFHEFGHLMHSIFSGQRQWAGLSNVLEWDFVEAPSQMLEEWMRDPKVLATFAHHYKTNQPIPEEMVARANRASAYGRGMWVRMQLVYTAISFDMHDMQPPAADQLDAIAHREMQRYVPFLQTVEGEHFIASFGHLTGYSSAYYTYLWDKVIAEDFFAQFDRNNLLGDPSFMRYRQTVLEQTGGMPSGELVKAFLGREQNIDAFSRWMNEEFASAPATTAGASETKAQ
jgi:thimet oligopeptidase